MSVSPAEEIRVDTDPPYSVLVGTGVLERAGGLVEGRSWALLSDTNVLPIYGPRLGELGTVPQLAVPAGEEAKSFRVLEEVLDFLVAADLDRGSLLLTLGGGVVGDLGGLAAALFMRGIDVVQCPTTLLSQVDASVGGKTAVNLAAGKNLAGVFHQPRAVLADVSTLSTLPPEELLSGLGEVVKSALVGDASLLTFLEENAVRMRTGAADLLASTVSRCVRVKAGVVARDEREAGERKHLNLGHTFAHAIESVAGYGRIPHGVAVGTGIGLALHASRRTGLLAEDDLVERTGRLLDELGLYPDLGALRRAYGLGLPGNALIEAMRHDKKNTAGALSFVLVRAAGELRADCPLESGLLEELLA